jgi:HlyD family secretion protein
MRLPEPPTSLLDFAPEILALEKRPPAPLPRFVLYALLVLLAILLAWATFGRLDIVASAEGRLVPQTYLKIVQPADAGVLKEILIEEGDTVHAGQVLMRLDTTISDADRAIAAKEVDVRRLQLARIDTEISGRQMSGNLSGQLLFTQVDAEGRARHQAYQDALSTQRTVLAQAEADLEAARQQVIKLEKVLPTLTEEDASLGKLATEGNVARMVAQQKQRERITAEQDLRIQTRNVQSLVSRTEESRTRIAYITSDYRQQLLRERVEAQAALDKALQELAKQERRSELAQLRAPQDGIIKNLATYTVGAVVNAGTVLASLVPVEESLQAEVLVKNEDVGFVYPGQAVKVKLMAYPFQKYGLIDGKVARIAADADDTSQQDADTRRSTDAARPPASTYKVIVTLHTQELRIANSHLALAPGMRVIAEIKQGERTVLEYLLSPVQKTFSEAGRER